jgi:hypothetical protein
MIHLPRLTGYLLVLSHSLTPRVIDAAGNCGNTAATMRSAQTAWSPRRIAIPTAVPFVSFHLFAIRTRIRKPAARRLPKLLSPSFAILSPP